MFIRQLLGLQASGASAVATPEQGAAGGAAERAPAQVDRRRPGLLMPGGCYARAGAAARWGQGSPPCPGHGRGRGCRCPPAGKGRRRSPGQAGRARGAGMCPHVPSVAGGAREGSQAILQQSCWVVELALSAGKVSSLLAWVG